MISGARVRYILAALSWPPDELARRAGIPVSVVERARRAEGEAPVTLRHEASMRRAVVAHGRADLLDGPMAPPGAGAEARPGRPDRVSAPAAPPEPPDRGEAGTGPRAPAPEIARLDVRALRARLRMSRVEFARAFGLTLQEVQGWEKGEVAMGPAARAYLSQIAADPEAVRAALRWVISHRQP